MKIGLALGFMVGMTSVYASTPAIEADSSLDLLTASVAAASLAEPVAPNAAVLGYLADRERRRATCSDELKERAYNVRRRCVLMLFKSCQLFHLLRGLFVPLPASEGPSLWSGVAAFFGYDAPPKDYERIYGADWTMIMGDSDKVLVVEKDVAEVDSEVYLYWQKAGFSPEVFNEACKLAFITALEKACYGTTVDQGCYNANALLRAVGVDARVCDEHSRVIAKMGR